jgi:hypothetical protein
MFPKTSAPTTTIRNIARSIRPLGTLHQSSLAISSRTRRRFASTEAASSSSTSSSLPPALGDAKINKLVDDISSLSLLQAADLVSLLKVSRTRIGEGPRGVVENCVWLPDVKWGWKESADTTPYLDTAQHNRNSTPSGIICCSRGSRCTR